MRLIRDGERVAGKAVWSGWGNRKIIYLKLYKNRILTMN